MITLRPYQQQLKNDIYGGWSSGCRNVCAVLPTGGGKSAILSDIAFDYDKMGGTQAIIAHRNELIGQLSGHMAKHGIKHRLIASAASVAQITGEHRAEFGKSFINPDARCAVVSVDTLNARKDKLTQWLPQVGLWITDECHHVLGPGPSGNNANKWGKAAALFPNARGLGVTASPCRADGMGLGSHHDGVFDVMVQGPTMRELITMGALCDYEIAEPPSDFKIDDSEITASGDYSPTAMKLASERSHIVGDVVREYCRHALFKRAICFVTDVDTAHKTAKKFNDAGIRAEAVSSETPAATRAEYIRRFRIGEIYVLVNVDLFGEGFDVPACEVVIMARPTASLAVYLQQFGRALRVLTGKLYGLIIDHVGNRKRHGLPDKHHGWTLDRREKRAKKTGDPEDIPKISCKSCTRPYERFYPACPFCGAPQPLPDPASRTIEQVDGDLTLLDRTKLAAMRAATQLESPADIGKRVSYAAGSFAAAGVMNTQIERIAAQKRLIDAQALWAGHGRALGRSDAEMYRRFFIATGVDVSTAQTLPRGEMDKLSDLIEGWLS